MLDDKANEIEATKGTLSHPRSIKWMGLESEKKCERVGEGERERENTS